MESVLIALTLSLAVVAVLAGVGLGLAWGYRNGRDIALGRYGPPPPPHNPNSETQQNHTRRVGIAS